MDSKQILKADLLDLIFDSRNKDYGAYELRRHYNKRISRALLITGVLIGVTLSSIALANKWKPETIADVPRDTIVVQEIPPEEKKPEPLPEELPAKQPEPVRTDIYVNPRIVPNDQVEEPMVTQTDLDSSMISTIKTDGKPADEGISQPFNPTAGDATGIIEPPKKEVEIYTEVQLQAKFIGNWEKFLLRYLNGNVPVDNNASPGRYQVLIQFVVDVDGSVSDIRPLSNVGFGMEEEAIRVLKKATKWEPAIQNGLKVKAYRKQPITFLVNEE